MKHWMGKGLTGMRIFTSGSTHAEQETFFADEAAFPVWQYASDQGLSVCMQMRVVGPAAPGNRHQALSRRCGLSRPFRTGGSRRRPTVCLGRAAVDAVEISQRLSEADPPADRTIGERESTPELFLGKAVKEFGASRLCWGSNFPAAKPPLPELIAMARKALSFLPQGDQDQIFYKTALALYPALAKLTQELMQKLMGVTPC
jgi:Predicted metal-dependent hydrolase of the TIM-barrel fold